MPASFFMPVRRAFGSGKGINDPAERNDEVAHLRDESGHSERAKIAKSYFTIDISPI